MGPERLGPPRTTVPQGLESLLLHAAANPHWRRQLRQDPVRAAERARIPLTDSERLILAALPPDQLDGMIAGYGTTRSERRGFLGQLWVSAVGLLLGVPLLSGCHHDRNPGPAEGGIRADRPPLRGDEPYRTKGMRPDVPEKARDGGGNPGPATEGMRPDRPPARGAGTRIAQGIRPDVPGRTRPQDR